MEYDLVFHTSCSFKEYPSLILMVVSHIHLSYERTVPARVSDAPLSPLLVVTPLASDAVLVPARISDAPHFN